MEEGPQPIGELERALGEAYVVVDHKNFVQVVNHEGEHVAIVAFDPLLVEVEISVVLPVDHEDDQTLITWATAADAFLRAEQTEAWAEQGFHVAPHGEVRPGEVEDDPDRTVWSYDLPLTTRAVGLEQVREIVDFAMSRDTQFVLWEPEGPLTALRPA